MFVDYDNYHKVRNLLMRDGKWDEVNNLKIDPISYKLHEIKEKIALAEFSAACSANTGGFLGPMC